MIIKPLEFYSIYGELEVYTLSRGYEQSLKFSTSYIKNDFLWKNRYPLRNTNNCKLKNGLNFAGYRFTNLTKQI